jgi:hypothetical protein
VSTDFRIPRPACSDDVAKKGVCAMVSRDNYLELKGTSRDLKPTYYFVMKCLLYSRMETGLVSNKDYYDEDVNVYIAHLLNSFINPEYIQRASKYLSKYDTEVFKRLENSKDARLKYTLYKTNADFLLISLGIFDNPQAFDPVNPSNCMSAEKRGLQPQEEAYIGRGKTYYRFAYTYSQQIHNPQSAITEVMEKLSTGFEKYVRILSHMRGEYLNLMDRLSRGEVFHLERHVDALKKFEDLKAKQDRFLDLYMEWKRSGNEEIRGQIEQLVSEIKAIDPSFTFELPRERTDAA